MHSVNVALLVFAFSFGGALVGMALAPHLPPAHLSKETQQVVKMGMGTIATLSGLVLGLLVSTSKGEFDTTDAEVKQISAKLLVLDRDLSRYGPETKPARAQLRHYVELKIDEIWSREVPPDRRPVETAAGSVLDDALDRLGDLTPQSDAQRRLKSTALALAGEIAQARWLLIEQHVGSVIPTAFLVIVVFWLTVLLLSFGLFAPRNALSIAAMLACSLSLATALFLVVELGRPFGGIIQISSAAARNALAHMGR